MDMSVIWPEIAAPADVAGLLREEIAYHRSRVVWGEGAADAQLVIVLDNPGAREDKAGEPYVCGTRQTLQQGLTDAGIALDRVFVTYILKYRPTRKYDKPQAWNRCMPYLDMQLSVIRPRLVMCLGNIALRALLGDETLEVRAMRGDWHRLGELPLRVSYHPLAVRRRPNLQGTFLADCQAVADKLAELTE
jgi:uracil-DNA glycosylase